MSSVRMPPSPESLDQHSNHFALFCFTGESRPVVVGNPHETLYQRFETGLNLAVAGGGQGRQCASVEGFFHHDDGGDRYPACDHTCAPA